MAVASWMLRGRSQRASKGFRGRYENKEDGVQLDYTRDAGKLMHEILCNVCLKREISSLKKMNYLNAFVELLMKDSNWKPIETFGFAVEDILCWVALIQDCVQVRAVGLRAVRYTVRTPDDVICLNNLHFPYLISRSLDLILKTDNEKILMSERIQALRLIRHILSISPQNVVPILVRPLVSLVLRPLEETDRLLKTCLAILCELCILNSSLFIECNGVTALLRNINLISSCHIAEAMCGALLFLLNKPSTRQQANIDLQYIATPYTSINTSLSKIRNEEIDSLKTNTTILSLLRSWSGLLYFCHPGNLTRPSGLRSVIETLNLNHYNTKKAILHMLYELIGATQPEWTENMSVALDSVDPSRFRESFRISEGFVIAEANEWILPLTSKFRVNLVEIHLALILYCLIEADLADTLVEVIVNSDSFLSIQATILLGQFSHLVQKFVPPECYFMSPPLSNLISYSIRGCPIYLPYIRSRYPKDARNPSDVQSQYTDNLDLHSKKNLTSVFAVSNECTVSSDIKSDQYISDSECFAESQPSNSIPYFKDSNTRCQNCSREQNENQNHSELNINNTDTLTPMKKQYSDVIGKEFAENADNFTNPRLKNQSNDSCLFKDGEIPENILNIRSIDLPSCRNKQQKALSAISSLCSLHKILHKPLQPSSSFFANVIRNTEKTKIKYTGRGTKRMSFVSMKIDKFRKSNQTMVKQCDSLVKKTSVLLTNNTSLWKWDSIRAVLKVFGGDGHRKLNNASFRGLLKRLVLFYKPSSMQFSKTDLKEDNGRPNNPTLTACEFLDFLLETDHVECNRLLNELLKDIDHHLGLIVNSVSVHNCLFSPQHVTNSLCQDYFLLIGRLTGTDEGLVVLEQTQILQHLYQIASTTNLDCYIKLIISNLSYIHDGITRKILCSVMSSNYISARLYATRFAHILLRLKIEADLAKWLIELIVNQLYDENNAVSLAALTALDEAADNKNYLDFIIGLRPTLLHLGDKGLLLLIRFLSTEQGFTYLQTANFITPQLQRWASTYNRKYVKIIEGELHDSLTQYQRGDDGIYRQRVIGIQSVVKQLFVPPHLYGQLAQHSRGFQLLKEQENFHHLIQVILNGSSDTDETILELKAALWALGHVATTVIGVKFLVEQKLIESIIKYAESSSIFAVKATAFNVLSMIATTEIGASELSKKGWKCLKHNRSDSWPISESPFEVLHSSNKIVTENTIDMISPSEPKSPQDENSSMLGDSFTEHNAIVGILPENLFKRKCATLPHKSACDVIQRNRSLSESKADVCDDWSNSNSPSLNLNILSTNARCSEDQMKYDSCTDSSTSGISSCDSATGKSSTVTEKIQTLSPIPSSSSLATVIANSENGICRHSIKRHSSLSFGCRLNAQNAVGYRTLRMLQSNRHHMSSSSSSLSASATMDLLTIQDRRQMSPLIRPKLSRYLHQPLRHEFEVKEAPFQIADSGVENSEKSTDDGWNTENNGACYQGICLPAKLSYLFPNDIITQSGVTSSDIKKTHLQAMKSLEETEALRDSEVDISQTTRNKLSSDSYRKRRHDRSACLLCSLKENNTIGHSTRSRKTSSSSIHRIRTETESSYGGLGTETDSPILLTWQPKPVGLIDAQGACVSSSTTTTDIPSPSHHALFLQENNPVKSRSLLRKEVLKLIENLGNPVLYKTCKQGLIHLKQLCADLFQDVCLFSDVCALLGSVNYRVQARQLIQDLFFDASFHELYDEPLAILERIKDQNIQLKPLCPAVQEQTPPQSIIHKHSKENPPPNECRSPTNYELEVIIETDSKSDTGSAFDVSDGRNKTAIFGTDQKEGCVSDISNSISQNTKSDYSNIDTRTPFQTDEQYTIKSSTPNRSDQNIERTIFSSSISPLLVNNEGCSSVVNLSNLTSVKSENREVPNFIYNVLDFNFPLNDSYLHINNNKDNDKNKIHVNHSNNDDGNDRNIITNYTSDSTVIATNVCSDENRDCSKNNDISYNSITLSNSSCSSNNNRQGNCSKFSHYTHRHVSASLSNITPNENRRHRKFATTNPPDQNLLLESCSIPR